MREWIYAKRVVIPTPRERINSRILEVRPLTATKKKKEERKGCKKRSFSLKTPSPAELLTLVNTESGSMDSNRLLAGNERWKGKKKKTRTCIFVTTRLKAPSIDRARINRICWGAKNDCLSFPNGCKRRQFTCISLFLPQEGKFIFFHVFFISSSYILLYPINLRLLCVFRTKVQEVLDLRYQNYPFFSFIAF